MDRFGITLIMWFHGLMSVQAKGAGFDSVQRIKVAHYDAAANRVIIIHEAPRVLRLALPLGGR